MTRTSRKRGHPLINIMQILLVNAMLILLISCGSQTPPSPQPEDVTGEPIPGGLTGTYQHIQDGVTQTVSIEVEAGGGTDDAQALRFVYERKSEGAEFSQSWKGVIDETNPNRADAGGGDFITLNDDGTHVTFDGDTYARISEEEQ